MMTRLLAPDRRLGAFVAGYLVVDDLDGAYAHQPIVTCPEPMAVLSVNFAKGAIGAEGAVHPRAALLGLQTRARAWRPQDETFFVAVFLRVPGMMALFPGLGRETADRLVALDDLWGDRRAAAFRGAVPDRFDPAEITARLDAWCLARLTAGDAPFRRFARELHDTLVQSRSIAATCRHTGLPPRRLQRLYARHVGLSPRSLLNLERLRSSIADLQRDTTDRSAGFDHFSDQSHQIRIWRRHLGLTPTAYRRDGPSAPAAMLAAQAVDRSARPVFWL
jgi:AraC-like DNA-binding protein